MPFCFVLVCVEIVVHRMFTVFLNGLNGKNSSRSIVRNISLVYLFILVQLQRVFFCHTDCYLGNQDCNASVNSSCVHPHPPGLLRGICPPCQSRGWGVCKFCAARGTGICQPRGQPRAFDTHAVSCQNTTAQRILLEKQGDWLICQGQETMEEVCKGMFSILCMHVYIAYQVRITGKLELST